MHFSELLLSSLLHHFSLCQASLDTEIETSYITIPWPGTTHSRLKDCCVWPIKVWLNWLISRSVPFSSLFLWTIIHFQAGDKRHYPKRTLKVPESFITLISAITPSDFQLRAIFHLSTEEWVFWQWTWEMQETQWARLEGGQPTHRRSQQWQWMHQETLL